MRYIARLDIKNNYVIKGIHLEGLRKVGDPVELAEKYYIDGADELLLIDSVASLYGRNSVFDVIKNTSKKVFIPITVGGGIRSLSDAEIALDSGADKIALNSILFKNALLLNDIAKKYGSQCAVASVQAKKTQSQKWEAYSETGRQPTGIDNVDHIKNLLDNGAGEILLTSIDMEGTKKGFDIELAEMVSSICTVPLIVSGGLGSIDHIDKIKKIPGIGAITASSVLHYEIYSFNEIKSLEEV